MGMYWLKVGRHIFDDPWKSICWSFSYDCCWFAPTTPVRVKLTFSQFSDKDVIKHLLELQLWHLFKYAELTEAVRLNDKFFIDLFNKVQIGNIDDDVEHFLKARFIRESDKNYPKDTFHMYAENEPAMKKNEAVLNELPGELYTIETNEKITDNCKYP